MRDWLSRAKSALIGRSTPVQPIQGKATEVVCAVEQPEAAEHSQAAEPSQAAAPSEVAEQGRATEQGQTVEKTTNLGLEALHSQSVSLRELARRQQDLEDRVAMTEMRAQRAEQRVEFVRREIMFELASRNTVSATQYDGADPSPHGQARPRIVDPAKIRGAGGALRLNLGCGHIPLPEYVNVDFRELPGVDVIAAAGDLPFEPASVSEIFSSHMLEHFPLEDLRRVLLPYWISRLKPGGLFRAIVPDADAMMRAYVAGEMSFADITEVTFGTQDYVGNQHYTMFSKDSIRPLLQQAGFTDFKLIAAGRRNGLCLEMEFSAVKPATMS